MGVLTSSQNQISFAGDFDRSDLKRTMAALHNVRKDGFYSARLNFTDLTKAFTPEILPLAVYCRSLLHQGYEVVLDLPKDNSLRRLFENSNWAYLIDPRSFQSSQFNSSDHLPAIMYANSDEQFVAVEKVIDLSLRYLKIKDRQQLASIEWSINELADNVLNHAHSAVGGILQVSARPSKDMIEYVICDAGLGIPRTLRDSHPEMRSDLEALDRAIREGVTRNQITNMGNGLFGTYRLAQLSGGSFYIYSGYASLNFSTKNGLHVRGETVPFVGTLIVCSIKISDPDLLSEALTFRGSRHTPYSTVDRLDEETAIDLRISDESGSFGSRQAAKPVRQKIENLLRTTTVQIVVDLDDVPLITSSFADEVFGKLYADLGSQEFKTRILIKGGNRIVRQLIDRAIAQRAALE